METEGDLGSFHYLETQVAGHKSHYGVFTGMLTADNGRNVLKPYGKPSCGARELNFYESLEKVKNLCLLRLKEFVPKFKGEMLINVNGNQLRFLKMENLTYRMNEPCVIDIKIGKRTWDPEATNKKRFTEENKYIATKHTFGICVPGLQVYCLTGRFLRFGKEYGKKLNQSTLPGAFSLFLNFGKNTFLIRLILNKLYKIQHWFEKKCCLKFFSTSILMAYDCGNLKALANNNSKIKSFESFEKRANYEDWVKIKMIDFAHVFVETDNSVDINYVHGLQSLICIIENFLNGNN